MGYLILFYFFSIIIFAFGRASTTKDDGIFWYLVGCPGSDSLWSFLSLFLGGFITMLTICYFIGYFTR